MFESLHKLNLFRRVSSLEESIDALHIAREAELKEHKESIEHLGSVVARLTDDLNMMIAREISISKVMTLDVIDTTLQDGLTVMKHG